MTDPIFDQAAAAVAEARSAVRTVLGLAADTKPGRGRTPFMDALLDAHLQPDTPRCAHLAARPVQVWMMVLPHPAGAAARAPVRSSRAGEANGSAMSGVHLRPVPPLPAGRHRLTPTILRQDLWIVHASLCRRCVETGKAHGAMEIPVGGVQPSLRLGRRSTAN